MMNASSNAKQIGKKQRKMLVKEIVDFNKFMSKTVNIIFLSLLASCIFMAALAIHWICTPFVINIGYVIGRRLLQPCDTTQCKIPYHFYIHLIYIIYLQWLVSSAGSNIINDENSSHNYCGHQCLNHQCCHPPSSNPLSPSSPATNAVPFLSIGDLVKVRRSSGLFTCKVINIDHLGKSVLCRPLDDSNMQANGDDFDTPWERVQSNVHSGKKQNDHCHQCPPPPPLPPCPPCPPPSPFDEEESMHEVRQIATNHLMKLQTHIKEIDGKTRRTNWPGICLCNKCQAKAERSGSYPTINLCQKPLLREVNLMITHKTASSHWDTQMEEINKKKNVPQLSPPPDQMFISIDRASGLIQQYLQGNGDLSGNHIAGNFNSFIGYLSVYTIIILYLFINIHLYVDSTRYSTQSYVVKAG
jgi:hypothetical protein